VPADRAYYALCVWGGWGWLLLHRCSALVLEADCDVDIPNQHGATPLHVAALRGHTAVVRAIIEAGKRRGRRCRRQLQLASVVMPMPSPVAGRITPLHFACMEGHEQVVQLLLGWGDGGDDDDHDDDDDDGPVGGGGGSCDRDAVDFEGNTALHWACKRNHRRCALLLVRAGCNTALRQSIRHRGGGGGGGGGLTALEQAAHSGHTELVEQLRAAIIRQQIRELTEQHRSWLKRRHDEGHDGHHEDDHASGGRDGGIGYHQGEGGDHEAASMVMQRPTQLLPPPPPPPPEEEEEAGHGSGGLGPHRPPPPPPPPPPRDQPAHTHRRQHRGRKKRIRRGSHGHGGGGGAGLFSCCQVHSQ
jgi:hypothetical protein